MPRETLPLGTERPTKEGYVLIKTERGWQLKHRAMMEQRIGRRLRRGEQVHHDNEVRDDNRDDNLILTTATIHAQYHFAMNGGTINPGRKRPPTKRCQDCGKPGRKKIQEGRCGHCRAVYQAMVYSFRRR